MMQPTRRRVIVRSDQATIQELLLVLLPDQAAPAFTIQQLDTLVLSTGALGVTRPFPALVGKLLAMSPTVNRRLHDPLRRPRLGIAPVRCLSRASRGNHHRRMGSPQQLLGGGPGMITKGARPRSMA